MPIQHPGAVKLLFCTLFLPSRSKEPSLSLYGSMNRIMYIKRYLELVWRLAFLSFASKRAILGWHSGGQRLSFHHRVPCHHCISPHQTPSSIKLYSSVKYSMSGSLRGQSSRSPDLRILQPQSPHSHEGELLVQLAVSDQAKSVYCL